MYSFKMNRLQKAMLELHGALSDLGIDPLNATISLPGVDAAKAGSETAHGMGAPGKFVGISIVPDKSGLKVG